jgi:hypothetical protein
MKRFSFVIAIALFCAVSASAIGLQHGLFRSQSTQGKAWTGTMTFVREAYNITVYPDYLDVELEWELGVGGTPPDSFQNALEIVGNINFERGSVVVGMVLWNNDILLKAKLKTNQQATQQYEEVVDRNAPVPPHPRDPVLLTWVGNDNYDISIFPVTWGKTRTLRIRYLVPAYVSNGVNAIGYPHAFSSIATVSIKNGPGVDGYTIESGASQKTIAVPGVTLLSPSDYGFQAWGGSGKTAITRIIPIVPNYSQGSRLFYKDFACGDFSGQMVHFAGMQAADVMKLVRVKDDYVILWRWNHPDILKKYACQIVAQSNLIKVFLATLEAREKRAGMIVDMQGGERKTFELDKKGGKGFQQMMDFLSSLSALKDVAPPKGAPPAFSQQETDSIVKASFNEFQAALRAAMLLFNDPDAQKHLLILTAGPRWTTRLAADQAVAWDSTADATSLLSYLSSNGLPYSSSDAAQPMHWPGVDLDRFQARPHQGLRLYASLTNGKDTNRVLVQDNSSYTGYYSPQTGTEMRIYTAQPIVKQVTWGLYAGDKLIGRYRETPFSVEMHDAMQYARLIGSSSALVPMAEHMPSSLASTLGFIDSKYGLLALEQDTLDARTAARYAVRGVPTLHKEDIFAAADEKAEVPVADWLLSRQPVNSGLMPGQIVNIAARPIMVMANPAVPVMFQVADAAMMVQVQGVMMIKALPGDTVSWNRVSASLIDSVPQEASSAITVPAHSQLAFSKATRVFTENRRIVIALDETSLKNSNLINVVLYDVRGKVVKRFNQSDISPEGRISWSPRNNGLAQGIFIVKISIGVETISSRIIVR